MAHHLELDLVTTSKADMVARLEQLIDSITKEPDAVTIHENTADVEMVAEYTASHPEIG